MRAVVQRVSRAVVRVGDETVGEIGPGLCVLVGVTHTDGPGEAKRMAAELANMRLFDDGAGVMNRSVVEAGGGLLVVSQFTLYGDTSGGRRPSWSAAAPRDHARPLVEGVVAGLRDLGVHVATGSFGRTCRWSWSTTDRSRCWWGCRRPVLVVPAKKSVDLQRA